MRITTLLRQAAVAASLVLVAGLAQQAHAQAGGGNGTGGPAPEPDPAPTTVPIDGGATLLLAGSVAYGLRKLRQRRK